MSTRGRLSPLARINLNYIFANEFPAVWESLQTIAASSGSPQLYLEQWLLNLLALGFFYTLKNYQGPPKSFCVGRLYLNI